MSSPGRSKMRFLMLNWRDPRNPLAGGAERVTLAFLRDLVGRGHDVDWFTFHFSGAPPEEQIDGIRILRAGGVFSAILAARRWYRRQPRYDLVIDQHHGIPWYAPWWSGVPTLGYIHEVLGPIWSSFYRWPMSQLGPRQERWTHWLYRDVPFWVPSDSTRRALLRHGVRRIKVLDNGIDIEPLEQLPDGPGPAPLRLIAISRLAPNKRVDHAIECVGELRRRGLPAVLTVIGDGTERARLGELTARLGLGEVVHFAGYQTESAKLKWMRDSHVLVHPSVREGWGLNVIEANAMGIPAVVYPVDGLVDSTVDGVTGVVCRGENPKAMADGVAWLMGDGARYRQLREGAWKRSFGFRWPAVLSPASEYLEGLAGGQKMV